MMQKVNDKLNQLPLDFKNAEQKTFSQFVSGNNSGLINSLKTFSQSEESLFYFWGDKSSGKSHILQAFIGYIESVNLKAAIMLPDDLKARENVSLIEMFDIVCIDNTEEICDNNDLEEALFFWINEVRQKQKKIILASQLSHTNDQWKLPDLRSRMQSGRTHELISLGRDEVFNVFMQKAVSMGIEIDERVGKYITTNCPMNMNFMTSLLFEIDKATLVEKKVATIPLIKKILNSLLEK